MPVCVPSAQGLSECIHPSISSEKETHENRNYGYRAETTDHDLGKWLLLPRYSDSVYVFLL